MLFRSIEITKTRANKCANRSGQQHTQPHHGQHQPCRPVAWRKETRAKTRAIILGQCFVINCSLRRRHQVFIGHGGLESVADRDYSCGRVPLVAWIYGADISRNGYIPHISLVTGDNSNIYTHLYIINKQLREHQMESPEMGNNTYMHPKIR